MEQDILMKFIAGKTFLNEGSTLESRFRDYIKYKAKMTCIIKTEGTPYKFNFNCKDVHKGTFMLGLNAFTQVKESFK